MRPTTLPEWAENPGAGKPGAVTPGSTLIADGWNHGDKPAAPHMNDRLRELCRWSRFLYGASRISPVLQAALNPDPDGTDTCDENVNAACYSTALGAVVAVGSNGYIGTSTYIPMTADILDFTTQTPASSYTGAFAAVAEDGTYVCAAGSSGVIQRSADGSSWSQVLNLGSGTFFCLATDGTNWVAAGASGLLYSSDDNGGTWTARTPAGGFSGNFEAAIYAAGKFVLVGSGEVQTSSDGVTWTRQSGIDALSPGNLQWIAYGEDEKGDSVFLTGVAGTTFISEDAVTWELGGESTTGSYGLSSVVHLGNGVWCGVEHRDSPDPSAISMTSDLRNDWEFQLQDSLLGDDALVFVDHRLVAFDAASATRSPRFPAT